MSDNNDEGGGGAAGRGEKTVPYERFQAVVTERNELRSQLTTAKTEAQSFSEKAATADTLSQTLAAERTSWAKERASFETRLAFGDGGFNDDEGREAASLAYNRLPEKDRPPISKVIETWKADPTKAPRIVQPWLNPPAAGAGGAGAGGSNAGDGKRPPPSTRTGADPNGAGAASGEPLSAAKLREIRERAQKTGDWTEWKRVTGQAGQQQQGGQGGGGARG